MLKFLLHLQLLIKYTGRHMSLKKYFYIVMLVMVLPFYMQAQQPKKKYYFLRIQDNHKWGLRTFGAERKIILPCEYERLDDWYNGFAILGKGGKYGMIDSNAKLVIPLEYTEIKEFHSGLARVKSENGKYGFITPMAQFAIQPMYDNASEFYEKETGRDIPTASVEIAGKKGLISMDGKTIIPIEMDEIGEYKDGMALCKKEGKYGFIDMNGQWIVQPQFAKILPYKMGMAHATLDGNKWGLIDPKGNFILQPKYEMIRDFVEGMAAILEDGKWGFANMTGQVLVTPQYTEVRDYVEGFAAVKYPEKGYKGKPEGILKDLVNKKEITTPGWGFVDKIGTQIAGPFYQDVHDYKSGIAIITVKGGTIGFINRRGEFKRK